VDSDDNQRQSADIFFGSSRVLSSVPQPNQSGNLEINGRALAIRPCQEIEKPSCGRIRLWVRGMIGLNLLIIFSDTST
jgi:hypothetical protein